MTEPRIALAGASGDLGLRICKALLRRGAAVSALLRSNATAAEAARVADTGARVVRVDPGDGSALASGLEGSSCVVSALNGLRDVIVERQSRLLEAAIAAG